MARSAIADDNFFLEIGDSGSSESIESQWNDLSVKHKNLLGKLKFYPKQVTSQDGQTTHVIQAGSIVNKSEAERICKKLFAKNISCFVIEGVEETPPSKSSDISQLIGSFFSSSTAPTIVDSAPKVLGKFSSPQEITEKTIAPPEQAEGKVEVAQAIPVPLSVDEDYNKKTVINTFTEEKNTTKPSDKIDPVSDTITTKNLSTVEFASGSAVWLDISSFESESAANKFWSDVRSKYSSLTAGMRVRIKKSLQSSSVQLSFGPFSSRDDANSFCSKAVITLNSALTCNFQGSNFSVSDNVQEVPARYEHSNAYEERRKELLNSYSKQSKVSKQNSVDYLTIVSHEDGNRNFWAQIVIADSKSEAENRIKEIQSANSDILDGISSSVSSSPMRKTKYNARLGPLPTEQAAKELCDTLQQRGIDCLVITTK